MSKLEISGLRRSRSAYFIPYVSEMNFDIDMVNDTIANYRLVMTRKGVNVTKSKIILLSR
ncbi:MAG: hypothetical protein JSV13_04695 [Nitrospiraceae bacterium]|nr:MAG: hypothetical protein JSV13_04695 [Nitrospiraceae bacterium]